jgi:hypothetical protein
MPPAFARARVFAGQRRSKYSACRVVVDGYTFASKREARRYAGLSLRLRVGDIVDLVLQPRFPIWLVGLVTHASPRAEVAMSIDYAAPPVCVSEYRADFSYYIADTGEFIVEDSKGFRTETYRLKKRLVEAQYGIVIHEV